MHEYNNISICKYLSYIGAKVEKTSSGGVWYCSPFRNEKTASFKVDLARNVWRDFGAGVGGGLVDLVMNIRNCDFKEAVNYLSGCNFDGCSVPEVNLSSFQSESGRKSNGITVNYACKLTSERLMAYVKSRKIAVRFAQAYTLCVNFTVNGKTLYAVGFKNDNGGYVLRNPVFKACTSSFVTTIYAVNSGRFTSTLNIFEGFFDFLSACTWFNKRPNLDTIVLNSTVNTKQIIPVLRNYETIQLFLDNDKTGQDTADLIRSEHNHVVDCSGLYSRYNDFNEFLINNKTK